MSYDYNQLVSTIQTHLSVARTEQGHAAADRYEKASSTFQELSQKCDMTPLLWMQYSYVVGTQYQMLVGDGGSVSDQDKMAALELQRSTLEMGVAAFPGCALLRLYTLELLTQDGGEVDPDTAEAAFEEALLAVGTGSHCNEGEIISRIYRLYAQFLASHISPVPVDRVKALFVRRAEVPLRAVNDGIIEEFRMFCDAYDISISQKDISALEGARRYSARTFGMLQSKEDDIDVAMHMDQILTRHEFPMQDGDLDWDLLLRQDPTSYRLWNGLGGTSTSKAFITYAQTCARYVAPSTDDDQEEAGINDARKQVEEVIQSLALPVYERAVAECPTVEALWSSYLKYLIYLIRMGHSSACGSKLQAVADRATRNCPYSQALVQLKLRSMLILAEAGLNVLDPDAILSTVQSAIGSKFFVSPASYLDIYMSAIMTVKRRAMSLLASQAKENDTKALRYDEAEPLSKKGKVQRDAAVELSEDIETEVQDMVEDIREMYDAADEFLRKNHGKWSEGRSVIWKDRAMTEAFFLEPFMVSLDDHIGDISQPESFRCFEKLMSVHQPPHPENYSWYVREILHRPVSSPVEVIRRLRTVRSLYQKAVAAGGKDKGAAQHASITNRTIAFQAFCREYLEFERVFGSDESHDFGLRLVRKKLEAISSVDPLPAISGTVQKHQPLVEHSQKRKRSTEEDDPAAKKAKTLDAADDVDRMENTINNAATSQPEDEIVAAKAITEGLMKKSELPKVRIGKLEYPAHPFTVRVSNLAIETDDMDLVDVFRPKCGAIVHSKIIREKNFHVRGKSKGWGLIQFEGQESVDKALALNDVIGIHEKVVQVSRSHVPAIGLVPAGMHRVNPKGDGKSSKRNQKRRDHKSEISDSHGARTRQELAKERKDHGTGETGAPKKNSVLTFRPRGLAHGHRHHKVKLSLPGNGENEKI